MYIEDTVSPEISGPFNTVCYVFIIPTRFRNTLKEIIVLQFFSDTFFCNFNVISRVMINNN